MAWGTEASRGSHAVLHGGAMRTFRIDQEPIGLRWPGLPVGYPGRIVLEAMTFEWRIFFAIRTKPRTCCDDRVSGCFPKLVGDTRETRMNPSLPIRAMPPQDY